MTNNPTAPEAEIILLEDSEGVEMPFEVLDTVTLGEAEYVVLLPRFAFDTDELVILEAKRDKSGAFCEYCGIDDFDLLEAVFEKFTAHYEAEKNPLI